MTVDFLQCTCCCNCLLLDNTFVDHDKTSNCVNLYEILHNTVIWYFVMSLKMTRYLLNVINFFCYNCSSKKELFSNWTHSLCGKVYIFCQLIVFLTISLDLCGWQNANIHYKYNSLPSPPSLIICL